VRPTVMLRTGRWRLNDQNQHGQSAKATSCGHKPKLLPLWTSESPSMIIPRPGPRVKETWDGFNHRG
jgi:hypothetical protein